MNYNFMAECNSNGINSTYLSMLDILNRKFSFKPRCFSFGTIGMHSIRINGKDISVFIQMDDEDNDIVKTVISSPELLNTEEGYFFLTLNYRDDMDRHLSVPTVSFSMCKKYGYLISDNGLGQSEISIDYYDNEAVSYIRNKGGSFKKSFIDPDTQITLLYGESVESTLAGLVCGLYDNDIVKAMEKSESKVYCKK